MHENGRLRGKNFKKVFEDNGKEIAKSRPSVYSVYLRKKICMLCIIDVVYQRHKMTRDVVSISD